MPGEVSVSPQNWQNTSKSTIDKAKDSTIAYKADGTLDAASTVRNIFNDLKSIKASADKENKANPIVDTQFSETSRGLVRTDNNGKQTLIRDAAGNYVAPIRDVTKDTGHKVSLKESAEAARQAAVMGGMETSKIPMSYSQENLADQIKKYQNMTFGAKMKANIGNTALNVGADLANAALTVPKYFGGEKVHNNSIYAVTNFLQEGVSGNTTLNTANMLETSNWLGKLVLQLEGTTVEQAIDLAAGGGAGSLIVMGSRVFGSSTREAEAEGKSVGKQLLTGLTRSGVEIVTELLGGVGGSYRGTGYGDAIFQNLDKWVADKTNSELLGTIASAFGSEATEEMVSDILNPIFDRLFKLSDGDTTLLQDIWGDGQILYDGLLGGLAGGFGSVTTAGGNYSAAKQLGVDVATYKVAERIVENKDARKRFEGYTGIKLDSDKDFAIAQAAVTLTANSNGDTTVREVERDILKGDREGVTYRNTLGAYLRAVNDANASLYNTVLMNAANSNDENVRAFADGIIRGKYAVNNANLGELAIMMEKSGDGSVRDIVQSAAKDLSGAQVMKYVNAAKSKAQQEYETMVSENPGKKVFNPIEQKLHDTTGWSAAKVEQQSGILAKVFSGVQYMTDADYKALDLNNTQVQQIFKEYTGIDISMARDDASRRSLLELAADAAVDTERYQQDLRDANEQFVNGRTAEILSPYEAQIKEAAKSAYAGTDLTPGRATSKNNNRYVIPPNRVAQTTSAKQANKATAKRNTSTVAKTSAQAYTGNETITIGKTEFDHDTFIKKYMSLKKGSMADAEAEWARRLNEDRLLYNKPRPAAAQNAEAKQEKEPEPKKAPSKPQTKATVKEAADNGRTGETVRSDSPVRQSDMADGGSVSEIQSGNAGSQQTADTGRGSTEAAKPAAPASDVRAAEDEVTPEAGYIEESNYSKRQQKFADDLKADGFESVRLAYSELKNDAGQDINAVVRGGDLTIRWSNDADRYADHERIHRWLKAVFGKNPVKRKEFVMRTLRNAVSEDVLTDMYAKYYDEYAKAYSSDVETYTERFGEEQASSYLEGLIYEEILCDMYAGIDYKGTNGSRYTYKIEPLIEMSGIREQALEALGMADTKVQPAVMTEERMTGTNAAEEEETAMPPEENMSIPEAAPETEAEENISEAVSPITEKTEDLSTDEVSKEETKGNSKELIEKLKSSIPQLENRPAVSELTGQEFQKSEKKLTEQVGEFFKNLGNSVFRKGFGAVIVDTRGIKSDISHGVGRAKAAAFAAVPDVIADGVQIDYQQNWKGRGSDSYVFASPVKINGKTSYMAVVVLKGSNNRFYLHEVVDSDGNIILIKNTPPSDIKTGVTAESGVTGVAESVVEENSSINNMPEISENVNTEIETDNQVTVNEEKTETTTAPVDSTNQEQEAEQINATNEVPPTAETPSEIADFGEKIGGARKDLWAERGMLLSDLGSMTEVEKGKYIKKDNVWPKADYAAMVEAGAEKDAVYFVKLVHDALPAAPQFRPTDTGETIQRRREDYITLVQIVRDVMSNVKTKQDAISAFNKVFVDNGYYYRNNAYDHGWTSKGRANLSITSRLVNALSTSARSWNYDVVNKMNKAQFLVSKEDKLPNGVSVKFYDGSGYSRDNSWQPNTWYVAKGYSIIQFNFEDEASARKWAQENLSKSAPANGKVRFVPKQLESVHRVGKNYRDNNTRNITGEDYMTTFGFRGGEFGNWVNQNERQISLNYGYDALMDLADALGISADDISLGGKLSIAFGARGRAGAAAHFEPERNVINLTKMNGAGTLAHEWAHALDYIVGQSLGARERMTGDLRKVNIPALNKLMEDMKYRPVSEEEAADQAKKANERALKRATYQINSWVTNVNDTAQQEVKRAEFMAKLPAADSWESASALAEEISAYRKETTGRIIPKEDRENLARAIYVAASPATAANGKTKTDFYSMSEKFDKQYSKQDKGYWSSDVEMFARAFACYITDKLSSGDLKSDYLSGHSDTSASILFNPDGTTEPIYAYPRGDERAQLNKDFDELIAALKENGSLTAAPPRANNFTTEAYAEGAEDYDIVRYSVADPSYENDPLKQDILSMVQAADNDPEEFARILGEWANMYANSPAPKTEQQTTRYVIPPANAISEEKQKANRNQLDGLIEKYGGLPTGENPARDFEAPARKDDGTYVYRFLRTAAEAEGTPDSMIPQIEQQILSAAGSYVRISDKAAISAADRDFERRGYDAVKNSWNSTTANPDTNMFPTKNDIAIGEKLAIEAANNGDTAQAFRTYLDLAAMATQAGQIVQAMRMLKQMGPLGQLYYVQKAVDRLNKQFEQRLAKNGQTIEINQDLAEDVLLAGDDAEAMDAAMDALIADIANQVPATLKDKIDAWRYLGMLGNARTHIRNIFGNVVFVPVRFTKDVLAAVGERRLDQSQRTKSAEVLLNPGKYKAVREFAAADFDENQQSISGNGKYNPTNAILQKRKVFKSKALNTLSEKNSDLLEREDARFLRRAYVSAMAQFLVARDVDIENADAKVMNEARQYATLEAQKATYRDASAVASALNRLAQTNKAFGFGLDAVLPFKKTPVNILKRGVEYSPVGLIKSATYGIAQLKSGKITAAEFIDNLAAGMTGTMVTALGIWLASLGIARGPGDDDKEGDLESTQGQQDYSLVIGDMSFTIDWLAPVSLPFFVGVQAYKLYNESEDLNAWDIYDALSLIAEPMLSLSMLDGINNLIQSAAYSENNAIPTLIGSAATSYASQFIPTILGQFARTIDADRRTNYVDKNKDMPANTQRFIQNIQGKIPSIGLLPALGLKGIGSKEKMAYVDLWGRKDTNSSIVFRAFENFVSPGYINRIKETPVDTELMRLARATGNNDVLPSEAAKQFTIDSKPLNLTADQYEQYAISRGQMAYSLIENLINSSYYEAMGDDLRAKTVKYALDYATAVAKADVIPDYTPSTKWMARANEAGYAEEAIIYQALSNTMDITGNKLVAQMDLIGDEAKGHLILASYSDQNSITDPSRKGYKYMLDDTSKAILRDLYDYYFWPEYYNTVYYDARYAYGDLQARVDILTELGENVRKKARTELARELSAAGFVSEPGEAEIPLISDYLNW